MTAQKPFLATTALESFWNKDSHVVFLGEWCRLFERKEHWQNLSQELAPQLWQTTTEIDAALVVCDEAFERALTKLSAFLNATHGTDHAPQYFRILLGDWLLHFIHVIYDRYHAVQLVFDAHVDLDTLLLSPDQRYIPQDYTDFISHIVEDAYNLQLTSEIIRHSGRAFRDMPCADFPSQPACVAIAAQSKSKHLLQIFSRALTRLWGTKNISLTDIYWGTATGKKLLKAFFRSKANLSYNTFGAALNVPITLNLLLRDTVLPIGDLPFEKLLGTLLLRHLPTAYLEAYPQLRSHALKQVSPLPDAFVTSVGIYCNLPFKFAVAEHHKDILLFLVQYGGGYGLEKRLILEDYERSISAAYFSWGWDTKKLPHPRLPRTDMSTSTSERILLVCNDQPRYTFRIHYAPMPSQILNEYLQYRHSFLQALPVDIPLDVRFYPNDYGWAQQKRLKAVAPHIGTAQRIDFQNAMFEAKLCIFDHLASTFLEALAANVPTLIFHSPALFVAREEAQPYLEMLSAAGILHHSPENAAAHLMQILPDVNTWWYSTQVQDARAAFAQRFAWTNHDWARTWTTELTNALNEHKHSLASKQ